ncbi:PIN domain nuclease [Streptomyces sp. NPDC060000]|uniref:PIN domain nuclease n=1 Tax=Streptomyces sp. NPDC060000 TaxID=3347031 RepID=UPI0036CC9A9A
MAVERFLVDKSAWERFRHSPVKARLLPLVERGLVATCAVVDLEILYSTRNGADHARVRMLREGFDWLPCTDEIGIRAVQVQGLLAAKGQHRRTSVADLLIAAVAERHGVTLLHYDADFEGIAEITGQATEWVVERGSVP